MDLIIQRVGIQDLKILQEVICMAWIQHYGTFMPKRALSFKKGAAWIGKIMKSTRGQGYLAYLDGIPVGGITILESLSYVELMDLFILDEYRGLGIGTELLDFAKSLIPNKPFRLNAMKHNTKARKFYEDRGARVKFYSCHGWTRSKFPTVKYEWPRFNIPKDIPE